MQVVITIEGSQADVFEQEPDELVQFSPDGEYTCTDGCGVLTYPESELTGMAGTLTTITFTPSSAVGMPFSNSMVIYVGLSGASIGETPISRNPGFS